MDTSFPSLNRIRRVGNHEFYIKYPILHKRFNAIYSITKNEIYYGCSKDCETCKQWNIPYSTWKVFHFFPIHCHFCSEPGHCDDFYFHNIFVMCNKCYQRMVKVRKNILFRELGRRIL